ncbi:hypothetical protein GCM10022240_00630 [Microbacterium kribbense]|uniref:ABC3 transporter permease C-terminal domain-containing protein n=1 Tax=Microbacterium kribbense TaxID=433645 RepID=A0ABP7FYS5_9MICO
MSGRGAGGIWVALRAAVTAPVVSTVVVVLVALVAFAGAALPALLQDARTATVQQALTALRSDALDPATEVRGAPDSGGGSNAAGLGDLSTTWGGAATALRAIHDRLPQPLRGVLGDPQVQVTFDGAAAIVPGGVPSPSNRVELTLDPGFASRLRIVAGALPQRSVDAPVHLVQIVLSDEAAKALDWPVGQRRTIKYPSQPMDVELSGIYQARDTADPAWQHQRTGVHPDIEQIGLGSPIHLARAYAAPQLLPDIDPWLTDARTNAWMPLQADRVDGAHAADLAAQLRGFAATPLAFGMRVGSWYAPQLSFRSAAPQLLDAGAARGDAMAAIVTLALIGPLTVAIAAVAMTGRMLASRRITTVRLARARGASTALLSALLAGEGLALGGIGAAAGAIIAAAMAGWAGAPALVVPVLAALAPAAAVPLMAQLSARRTARIDLGIADAPTRRRRLFIEAGVVLAAGAVLVAAVTQSPPDPTGPVLLAAPVAVFAICCVVVLRLVAPTIGLLERLLQRGRGVMAVLGPARARRGRTLPIISVLASLVCVATALLAGVSAATVAGGIQSSALGQTGAELRLTAPQIGADAVAAVRDLAGVQTVAPVYADVQLPARATAKWLTVTILAVDPGELAAVQHGVPDALALPAGFGTGAADEVQAVASDVVAEAVGEGDLQIHGIAVHLVASAPSPPFAATARWIVVDRADAARLVGPATTVHTLLVALDPDAEPAAVAARATAVLGTGAAAVIPAQVAAHISADPALQTVRLALWAALAAVIVLLVMTAAMTLLRGAPERGRVLGLLTAMGYPRGRILPLVGWEVGPPLLLALPVGIVAGFVLPPLLLSAVDLTRFVGGTAQPEIIVAGWLPWAVVAGFLVVAALAVATAAAVAARVTAAGALRCVDEQDAI